MFPLAFRPRVADALGTMDARIFRPEPMGLRTDILKRKSA